MTTASSEHEQIEELFSDYVDETLGEKERAEVDKHLEGCADCRAALASFRETMRVLSGIGRKAAPPEFEKSVEKTIEKRSGGRFFGPRPLAERLPLGAIAIVVLVLALIVYAFLRTSTTGTLGPLRGGEKAPEMHERTKDVVPTI